VSRTINALTGEMTKGKSPFYPGQPVPIELFVGRASEINRILTRGAGQVALGKPVAMYIQGEYGIGKSSIAAYVQAAAEQQNGLHAIYATMGGVSNLTEVSASVLEGTLRSEALNPRRSEKIRDLLGKYIGKQELFGFSIDLTALRHDAPNFSTPFGMLGFLSEVFARLKATDTKGLFLVLDEINGVTADPLFAHFIKGLVDNNSIAKEPLPLLLLLCGTEERRREMIAAHQPIDRIFDVIQIDPLNDAEMEEFFSKAFSSAQISVEPGALKILTHYSAGFPKIMHLIGDSAFWLDKDGKIDEDDAIEAAIAAAEEVGRKYVDQQIYKALQSSDYRSILAKVGELSASRMNFQREEVVKGLSQDQKRKFDNFLQKMKTLNVIRSGDVRGEYIFNIRMVRFYIWLKTRRDQGAKGGSPPS
jgi:hypothetical protein